jgi:renalase
MDADVLVVGTGLAGAAAARALAEAGWRVRALDKGRGPGGRLSTRRKQAGGFDHGAATLQANTPAFAGWLAEEVAAGRAAPWAEGYVGVPGMNSLVAGLLDGLDVHWSVAVAALQFEAGQWRAVDAEGRVVGAAPALVLAVPAPQAWALLRASGLADDVVPPLMLDALAGIRYASCWAALLETKPSAQRSLPDSSPSEIVEAIYREADKPGRPNTGHWVLHATTAWSESNLELDGGTAAQHLMDAFTAMTGIGPEAIRDVSAHRWRYARPLDVLDPLPLEGRGLVVAGDAFGAPACADLPPAERAWLSGRAAAGRLIAARQPKS